MIDKYRRRVEKNRKSDLSKNIIQQPNDPIKIEQRPPLRRCVISLGVNSPQPPGHPKIISQNYAKGIQIIKNDLLRFNFMGDFLYWCDRYPVGSPKIYQSFGGFKPYCFQEAIDQNYQLILYFDSSIRLRQSINPIFDQIKEKGFIIYQENHSVGEYCSDDALRTLDITRDESFTMPSCRTNIIGLNMQDEKARKFLNIWREKASDGITFSGAKWGKVSNDPRVKGHRYDQTAASVIALKLGMTPWEKESAYDHYFYNDRLSVRVLDE